MASEELRGLLQNVLDGQGTVLNGQEIIKGSLENVKEIIAKIETKIDTIESRQIQQGERIKVIEVDMRHLQQEDERQRKDIFERFDRTDKSVVDFRNEYVSQKIFKQTIEDLEKQILLSQNDIRNKLKAAFWKTIAAVLLAFVSGILSKIVWEIMTAKP